MIWKPKLTRKESYHIQKQLVKKGCIPCQIIKQKHINIFNRHNFKGNEKLLKKILIKHIRSIEKILKTRQFNTKHVKILNCKKMVNTMLKKKSVNFVRKNIINIFKVLKKKLETKQFHTTALENMLPQYF